MSSSDNPNMNMLVNSAYKSGTIVGLMTLNSWIMKRFLKIKPADLSKMDIEEFGKLTLSVWSSTMIRDWLVKNGYIPENIINE